MNEQQPSRQALHWLIALQDQPTDDRLRAEFESWLSAGEGHRIAWAEAQRVWNIVGKTAPIYADRWSDSIAVDLQNTAPPAVKNERELASPASSSPIRSATPRRKSRTVLATAGIGLAACLVLALPSIRVAWQADHHTGTGETAHITLRDGSSITLAADSAVQVFEDQTNRRVTLLKGEAFFEVTPDPARPFQVMAMDWTTTVRGTAFDVNLTGQVAAVAVEHGRVTVDNRGAGHPIEHHLEAGDWVRVGRQRGIVAQGHGQSQQVAAWRQGWLVAKSRTVGEVIADLQRHYHGLIVVTDSSLRNRLVSGVYDLRQPLQALRAVVQPHSAVIREATPYLVFVSSS